MSTSVRGQVTPASYAPPDAERASGRIASLDLMRGIVMVLMAIDHVRVYSGVPAGGDSAAVFFTRWVTHFCAPAFVFLAGTAAFFHGRKLGGRGRLAKYLVTRGAMLVVLELTVIRFSWTFNVDYGTFVLAGVIWMLGWCMILLGAMTRFSPRAIGMAGVAIVALQNLFGVWPELVSESLRNGIAPVWSFVYPGNADGPGGISILYVLVPWIGVMMAGYGFGLVMEREPATRDRSLRRIGIGLTAFFLIVGSALAARYADGTPFLFRLLGQRKYPASPLFLAMTLGPMIALLPAADRARGAVARGLTTIGRVPFFYYLVHIPLIHLSALAVNAMRTGAMHQDWYGTAPYTSVPEDQRWPLSLLYLVFAIDVALLYVACRWYARVKAARPGSWLRYL